MRMTNGRTEISTADPKRMMVRTKSRAPSCLRKICADDPSKRPRAAPARIRAEDGTTSFTGRDDLPVVGKVPSPEVLPVGLIGHLSITHGDREAESPENVASCRHHPGRAHDRCDGDHDALDVLGGQPSLLDSRGVG